jgi:ubiquinol-cytochrome c reductase cytochrome b subunit
LNTEYKAIPPQGRFLHWLDQRTGWRGILRTALDEPIPGGARLAYIFGSGLLFLFISQVVTGVFLAMYYVPSADHAHTTVAYITKLVTSGSLLRSIHAYGASGIIILVLLHIGQTFLYGSFKGRRELLWMSGCVLLLLMLGMAFTGYLLPWDQKAYFATAIGTNIASEVPLIGGWLKRIVRGGDEMGTLTISRFYVAHVFLLPALLFAFIGSHVFLFRKAGPAGPISEDPVTPTQPTEPFYPRQVVMDVGFTLLLIVALWVFAHFHPVELGPEANPADTQYLPRPEWYYRGAFQWLKYWQGPLSILGMLIIPALVGSLLFFTPLLDRNVERRPWKRPLAVGAFAGILVGIATLTGLSYHDDALDHSVAAQIAKQQVETREYMQSPFEPEAAASTLAATNVALANPAAAKGKEIFEQQSCNACHGDGGIGTAAAPKLIGIGVKYPIEKIRSMLISPTPAMTAGGMPTPQLNQADMDALLAYLESLK